MPIGKEFASAVRRWGLRRRNWVCPFRWTKGAASLETVATKDENSGGEDALFTAGAPKPTDRDVQEARQAVGAAFSERGINVTEGVRHAPFCHHLGFVAVTHTPHEPGSVDVLASLNPTAGVVVQLGRCKDEAMGRALVAAKKCTEQGFHALAAAARVDDPLRMKVAVPGGKWESECQGVPGFRDLERRIVEHSLPDQLLPREPNLDGSSFISALRLLRQTMKANGIERKEDGLTLLLLAAICRGDFFESDQATLASAVRRLPAVGAISQHLSNHAITDESIKQAHASLAPLESSPSRMARAAISASSDAALLPRKLAGLLVSMLGVEHTDVAGVMGMLAEPFPVMVEQLRYAGKSFPAQMHLVSPAFEGTGDHLFLLHLIATLVAPERAGEVQAKAMEEKCNSKLTKCIASPSSTQWTVEGGQMAIDGMLDSLAEGGLGAIAVPTPLLHDEASFAYRCRLMASADILAVVHTSDICSMPEGSSATNSGANVCGIVLRKREQKGSSQTESLTLFASYALDGYLPGHSLGTAREVMEDNGRTLAAAFNKMEEPDGIFSSFSRPDPSDLTPGANLPPIAPTCPSRVYNWADSVAFATKASMELLKGAIVACKAPVTSQGGKASVPQQDMLRAGQEMPKGQQRRIGSFFKAFLVDCASPPEVEESACKPVGKAFLFSPGQMDMGLSEEHEGAAFEPPFLVIEKGDDGVKPRLALIECAPPRGSICIVPDGIHRRGQGGGLLEDDQMLLLAGGMVWANSWRFQEGRPFTTSSLLSLPFPDISDECMAQMARQLSWGHLCPLRELSSQVRVESLLES